MAARTRRSITRSEETTSIGPIAKTTTIRPRTARLEEIKLPSTKIALTGSMAKSTILGKRRREIPKETSETKLPCFEKYTTCGHIEVKNGYKFLILPKNTLLFRASEKKADPGLFFSDKKFPTPSWYGNPKVAELYIKSFYKDGKIIVGRLKRDTRLFILSDVDNINKLIKDYRLFFTTYGAPVESKEESKEEKSKEEIIENKINALRFATGIGMSCTDQVKYIQEQARLRHDEFQGMELYGEIPSPEPELKRCSITEIDREVMVNLCVFLVQYIADGYVSSELFTGFGSTAPVFHEEISLCFAPDVVEFFGSRESNNLLKLISPKTSEVRRSARLRI